MNLDDRVTGSIGQLGEQLMQLAEELREREEASREKVSRLQQKFSEEHLSVARREDITADDYEEMIRLLADNEDLLIKHIPTQSAVRNPDFDVYFAPDKWKERIAEEIYHSVLRYFREQINKALQISGTRVFHVRFRPDGFEVVGSEPAGEQPVERQRVDQYLSQ